MLSSAFVRVEATYDLGLERFDSGGKPSTWVRMERDRLRVLRLWSQAAGGVTPQDERNTWIDR
jgi:hypothetical protein